jgi:uncharacterized protein YpmB
MSYTYTIQRKRKQQAIWFTVMGAIFTAITVAGMIYFTYAVAPHRM